MGGRVVRGIGSVSKRTLRTTVTVERLPEPDESQHTRKVSAPMPEDDYFAGPYGVQIKHADSRGHTLIPWTRVIAVEFRREEVAE